MWQSCALRQKFKIGIDYQTFINFFQIFHYLSLYHWCLLSSISVVFVFNSVMCVWVAQNVHIVFMV